MIPRKVIRSVVPVNANAEGLRLTAMTPPAAAGDVSVAVLLCHGFSSSPASVRLWAADLAARGYDVAVPRLPGHGTSWREMNMTSWTDWYDRVEQEYLLLAADHDVVHVGGLSMGGALAIRLAERHEEIPSVVLVNPYIATYDPQYVWVLPWLSRLRDSYPGVAGDIHKPDTDEYPSYDVAPLRAAYSMTRLWGNVMAHLDRFTAPALVFRSVVDHVIDDASVDRLRTLPNVEVRMLQDSYHVATLDYDAGRIGAESADFFDRHTPVRA